MCCLRNFINECSAPCESGALFYQEIRRGDLRSPAAPKERNSLMHSISRAIKDRPYDLNTVQGYFKYSFKYRPV